jgi:pimeloyl-ACP methyl ester carboxylesterase
VTLHIESNGSGRPVIVLPSFGFDHDAMAKTVEPTFRETVGWRRMYVDLPGTGGSPTGEPHSDAVLDDVINAIRSELGDQEFVVAGWSYGGYLAAGIVRHLSRQVKGLMMVCSGFNILPADRDVSGVLDSTPEHGWLDIVAPGLHDHFSHSVGLQTAEVAQRIAAALECNGPADDAYLSTLRTDGFALSDEEEPTRCDAPVSFLTGRRDRVAGYVGMFRALTSFDHCTFVADGEAGHYLPLERPHIFSTSVRSWLDQCRIYLDTDDVCLDS